MSSAIANVLATIGTVCWCVQLIPQIISNYRKKNTTGLPESMALLWCICAPFFAVYFLSEDSTIPIILQPHLFGVLCLVVYIQVMYYPPVSRPRKQIILRAGLFLIFWLALEISSVIPLRNIYLRHGIQWPLLIYGILASVLLAFGLVPPYFELAKRKGRVVGINLLFLATDLSGAVFSLASLAVDTSNFDIMGCVIYCICASLEVGIFLSHFIWYCRFKLFKYDNTKEDVEDKDNTDKTSSDIRRDEVELENKLEV